MTDHFYARGYGKLMGDLDVLDASKKLGLDIESDLERILSDYRDLKAAEAQHRARMQAQYERAMQNTEWVRRQA